VGALVDKLEEMVTTLIDLMKSKKKCTIEIETFFGRHVIGEDIVIVTPIISAAGEYSMIGFLVKKHDKDYTLCLKYIKRISWEGGELTREIDWNMGSVEQVNEDFIKVCDLLLERGEITKRQYGRWVYGERPKTRLSEIQRHD
jgi:hypothetical protein